MLLLPPENNSTPIPSPYELRRKILLKGSINGNGKEDLDKIIYLSTSKTPEGSYQMCSYEESDVLKLDTLVTIERTKDQFIRVYPYGLRIDSTNYNPTSWSKGVQMVALNYQTYDDPMLCNLAKFKDNGACGYLLKPINNFFSRSDSLQSNIPTLHIRFIEARLNTTRTPQMTVKLFRPSKDTPFETLIDSPLSYYYHKVYLDDLRIISIPVLDESIIVISIDAKSKDTLLYCAYPVRCLRTGYRVFPLSRETLEVPECFILTKITITINRLID